jgi:hypothetical protein
MSGYRVQKTYKYTNDFNRVSNKELQTIDEIKKDLKKLMGKSIDSMTSNNKLYIKTKNSVITYQVLNYGFDINDILNDQKS